VCVFVCISVYECVCFLHTRYGERFLFNVRRPSQILTLQADHNNCLKSPPQLFCLASLMAPFHGLNVWTQFFEVTSTAVLTLRASWLLFLD